MLMLCDYEYTYFILMTVCCRLLRAKSWCLSSIIVTFMQPSKTSSHPFRKLLIWIIPQLQVIRNTVSHLTSQTGKLWHKCMVSQSIRTHTHFRFGMWLCLASTNHWLHAALFVEQLCNAWRQLSSSCIGDSPLSMLMTTYKHDSRTLRIMDRKHNW